MKMSKLLSILFTVVAITITIDPVLVIAEEYDLPEPISNNAVAAVIVNGHFTLFSFNGLGNGKTYKDVNSKAYSLDLVNGDIKTLAGLPDKLGRLASIAVTVNNEIFVMGGYTVNADHTEVSTPEVYRYNPALDKFIHVSNMPTPVDDTVALAYQNRYIYLVSGWHNTDNVNLVQVYDTQANRWFSATKFPGAPVFGHAGGIVGNQLLIADGVKVNGKTDGKRIYGPSTENWLGVIDENNPSNIRWTKINKHPFASKYRMAAVGLESNGQIIFAGGSDNPYNFNGIGYDGNPSNPSKQIFGFDLKSKQWIEHEKLDSASMDHRGMLTDGLAMYILGGMGEQQKVLSKIQKISLNKIKLAKEHQ